MMPPPEHPPLQMLLIERGSSAAIRVVTQIRGSAPDARATAVRARAARIAAAA